jgi:trk system potassium uptake protein TrkA
MKFIVIGCGRVGTGLALDLVRRGHQVTVVDKDPLAFESLGEKFKGEKIVGVGFDRDILIRAGIKKVDGLAAVTASDEANVVAARIARDIFSVPKVVARLYDVNQAEMFSRLGLQTIAPITWGINRIADLLLYSPVESVYSIGSGSVELMEVDVPPLMEGKVVRDLTVIGEIQIVAITRANKTFIPTLGTIFQAGDHIHLALLADSLDRLNQLLGY